MLSVDKWFGKEFDRKHYNCWHFACDVWLEATGQKLPCPEEPGVDVLAPKFTEIDTPESPCLVLLERARLEPHVGVYWKGKVLHLNKRGAEYRSLDSVTACFTKVRFYK